MTKQEFESMSFPLSTFKSGIYILYSEETSKFYVGSSRYLSKRVSRHLSELRKNKHRNAYLQAAFNLGARFIGRLLEKVKEPFLCEREQYWIDKLNSADSRIGYNLSKHAVNPKFLKPATEKQIQSLIKVRAKKMPKPPSFSIEVLNQIRQDLKNGIKVIDIANSYNLPKHTIQCILRKKAFHTFGQEIDLPYRKLAIHKQPELLMKIKKELASMKESKKTLFDIARSVDIPYARFMGWITKYKEKLKLEFDSEVMKENRKIIAFKTLRDPNNVRKAKDNRKGYKPSAETKKKQSDSKKGKIFGTMLPSAKLNDEKIREIKQLLFSNRELTYGEIGEQFSVSQTTICSIANFKSWIHVAPFDRAPRRLKSES